MGQALYRKYRSKKLSEIVGQEHITATLESAFKSGKISHAYLFTGPRGVGKTSIARIVAHEINGLPYTDDSSHLDIIEIDAASNRRIDEVRDLRDKVHIAPAAAKYKVYIIDEVHMLTKEAFNALLKTLEEPPAHVVFILATTEVHKLPETIISRTQRFTFKPVEKEKVVAHLKAIAKTEGVTIEDTALELIAEHGEGSFRDSISLLDQASNLPGSISLADIQAMLGIAPSEQISAIWDAVSRGNPAGLLATLQSMRSQGYHPAQTARQLGTLIRAQLLETSPNQSNVMVGLLKDLLEVPATHDPEAYLELILVDASLKNQRGGSDDSSAPPKVAALATDEPPKVVEQITRSVKPQEAAARPQKKQAVEEESPEMKRARSAPPPENAEQLWQETLNTIKSKHNTLYGVLRTAIATFDSSILTLTFAFAFHQKRIKESRNSQVIANVLKELTGENYTIRAVVDKTAQKPDTKDEAAPASGEQNDLEAISNIFGSAEVLES